MASGLQYKNRGRTEAGYSNGISSGMVNDWTDTGLNGSHEAVFYWDDSGYGTGTSSRVYMTVRDSWTGTRNSDNSITLHITSSYTMNRVPNGTPCHSGCYREIGIFPGSGYNDTILQRYSNEIITGSASHSYSRSWDLTLRHGEERELGSFYVINVTTSMCSYSSSHPTEWSCSQSIYRDNISGGTMFRNTLPAPPYNPAVNISCGVIADTTNGQVTASVSDWGCPGGGSPANNCNNSFTVQWATDSSFNNIVATGTGVKGLVANTRYYTRAIASNGYHTTTKTCNFTTLASSYPYGYKFVSDQVSKLNVQINNGGDQCDIETKLYIRETGASSWTLVDTTSTEEGYTKTLRNLIQRGKTYQAYTTTTNCAGTYHSAIYNFAPPAADSITGVITKADGSLEASGLLADLDYCYKVTSYTLDEVTAENPITSRLEYRPEGQTDWVTTDDVISTTNPATVCGAITGLLCGTTYELRSYQRIGNISSYSAVVSVAMPLCADVNNCVCDNLNYMTELICQELNAIEDGRKEIYANCQAKELCDPYSETPTFASILSRIVRYSQMVACLLCSMNDLSVFRSGQTNQVYTATTPGSFGNWVDLSEEPIEGDDNLISSSAVKTAINQFLQSVLRPIGTYGFYAEDLTDLNSQSSTAVSGDTAVIGDDYYTYNGSSWSRTGGVTDLQNFGLIVILKGTWAGHEFYYWDDKWNLLDPDLSAITARIEALEATNPVLSYETTDYKVAVVSNGLTDAQILATVPTDPNKPTIIFVAKMTDDPYFTLDVDALDDTERILA